MTNISVIRPPITNNQAYAGLNGKGSHLAWNNALATSLINSYYIDSSSVVKSDPDLDFVLDYLSTTKYISKEEGDLKLQFDNTEGLVNPVRVNHVALGGLNFDSADIIEVKLLANASGFGYDVERAIDTSSRVSFYDGKPLMIMLDAIYDVESIRVIITTGEAQFENVEVTSVYSGQTLEFPNQPAIGFKKGNWNTMDEPRFSRRQSNAFGASTIKRQGTEEKVTIPVVPVEFMDTEWVNFIRKYEYVPVFFSWSLEDFPLDTIYGNITINDASYSSSLYSQISFLIKGVV